MAFNGFVDEFNNAPIQTSPNSYLKIETGTGTTVSYNFEWSFANPNTPYPLSQVVNFTGSPIAVTAYFPNASQASKGMQAKIINNLAVDINIYKYNSSTLIETIKSGQEIEFILDDNSTNEGTWLTVILGATTSQATAASLIDTSNDANGHMNNGGLSAFSTNYIKMNQRVNTYNGAAYIQRSGDRGSLQVWQGGNGTYTLLSAAATGNGFVFSVHNASTTSGTITITPQAGDTIDLDPFFTLAAGESASFISDGVNKYYSLGFGQQFTNVVTQTDISLSDAVLGVLTVSLAQAQNLILNFIGSYNAPTYDDVTIVLPSNYTNQYYIHNSSTTNNIIVQVGTGAPSNFAIVSKNGRRLIGFTDLSNFYNIPDFFELDQLSLENGSAAAPSLTFIEDVTTGLYRVTAGATSSALGIAQNATAVCDFLSTRIVPYKQIQADPALLGYSFVGFAQTGLGYNVGNTSIDLINANAVKFRAGATSNVSTQAFNTQTGNVNTSNIQQESINIYSVMRAYGV